MDFAFPNALGDGSAKFLAVRRTASPPVLGTLGQPLVYKPVSCLASGASEIISGPFEIMRSEIMRSAMTDCVPGRQQDKRAYRGPGARDVSAEPRN